VRRVLPLVAAVALLVSGCGAVDTVLERVRPSEDAGPPVATIVVVAPLSGPQTRDGEGVLAAVERAVTDSGGVEGWDVRVRGVDLAADDLPDRLDALVESDSAVAVVTGFSAQDVRANVPLLDAAGFSVLSPADSDVRHLRGADPTNPLRPWNGYASVAVDPTPEISALADHLVRAFAPTQVVVVTDGTATAAGRTETFTAEMAERGAAVASVLSSSADLTTPLAALAVTDVVVVDGPPEVAAGVAAATPAQVALMSRPQTLTPEQAAALEGAITPDAGLDPRRGSTELQALLGGSGVSGGPYGPAAYDAGRLLVDAMTTCLPDPSASSSPSRSTCRARVAGTPWAGLTGAIVFDEYGGRPGLLPGILTLRAGQWVLPGQ
jgi:ABC-type branched-subunit amino acid transport system substrate-binding protein